MWGLGICGVWSLLAVPEGGAFQLWTERGEWSPYSWSVEKRASSKKHDNIDFYLSDYIADGESGCSSEKEWRRGDEINKRKKQKKKEKTKQLNSFLFCLFSLKWCCRFSEMPCDDSRFYFVFCFLWIRFSWFDSCFFFFFVIYIIFCQQLHRSRSNQTKINVQKWNLFINDHDMGRQLISYRMYKTSPCTQC